MTQAMWEEFVDPDSLKPPKVPTAATRPMASAYSNSYTTAVARAQIEQAEPPIYNFHEYPLLVKEKEEYRFDMDIYTRVDLPEFHRQQREYIEVARAIQRTCNDVAKMYINIKDPLRTQLRALRDVYKGNPTMQKNRAREAYAKAIRRPQTGTPIGKWIMEWQEAMTLATATKLAVAMDYSQWTHDLAAAIGEHIPITIGRIMLTIEETGDLDTYRDVVRVVQLEMSMKAPIRPTLQVAGRRAFAAISTEDSGSGQSTGPSVKPSTNTKEGDKRHRAGTMQGCWGCSLNGHRLEGCYLANPTIRPPKWSPSQYRKDIWSRNKQTPKVINEMMKLNLPMPSDTEDKALVVLSGKPSQ